MIKQFKKNNHHKNIFYKTDINYNEWNKTDKVMKRRIWNEKIYKGERKKFTRMKNFVKKIKRSKKNTQRENDEKVGKYTNN